MLQHKEGQRVPPVTFRTRQDNQWKDVTTDQIFAGKTVIVFALPGAYTPTCSTTHLPRYNELAPTFSKLGVDEIVCLSVNDGFVMAEWQKDQDAPNVTFIPDGNGEFTEKMGMLVDKASLGFGKRSWRYSMLVRDGVVEQRAVNVIISGNRAFTPVNESSSAYYRWPVWDLDDIMSGHLRNYESLSVRVDRRFYFAKTNLVVFAGAWNLFGRKNELDRYWDIYASAYASQTMWGILPYVGFEFEF